MFDLSSVLREIFFSWPAILLFCLILLLFIGAAVVSIFFSKPGRDFSNYVKRAFLFDTRSEFELFKLLLELFGDRYHVFPQVHYSHVVEVKKGLSYRERLRYWNGINRKSADFVLCDKEKVAPQLVIELDGSSHQWEKRKERDEFVNHIMNVTNLPILHLTPNNMSKEAIREKVGQALAPK